MINITTGKYKGWKIWLLKNQWIQLHIAPQLGGRIIQVEMNGYEFFFTNSSLHGRETIIGQEENREWLNYGGEKIWPAPQGWDSPDQWPGPPDPVLDGGTYSISMTEDSGEDTGVRLTSPFDHYTGLKIIKDITLSRMRSEISVLASFKNESDVPRTWSIWPVCQMNTKNSHSGQYQIICPVNPESQFKNGYQVMHGLVNNPQYSIDKYGNLHVDYQYLVGKVGLDTNSDWTAFLDKGTGKVFVLMFNVLNDKPYPEGTSVQIWTQGKGVIYSRNKIREFSDDKIENPPYMELELLSPMEKIRPGDNSCFSYRMLTSTIPVNETVIHISEFAVIAQQLNIKYQKDSISITAKYGVFNDGSLRIKLENQSLGISAKFIYETQVNPQTDIIVDIKAEPMELIGPETNISTEIFNHEGLFVAEVERIKLSEYDIQ